jgi:hypothetical protein
MTDPWAISDAGYPAEGSPDERTRFLIGYAILAPSSHNSQPWLFDVDGWHVALRADRSRALPVVDPDDRELIISCGAALETLLVAARRFGLNATVRPAPDRGDDELLARIVLHPLQPPEPPGPADTAMFEAIRRRHTNRQAFERRDLPPELADRLAADAAAQGVWLRPVTGGARAAVADLIAEGDRTQMADKRFRRELSSWVHPNRSRSRDGMRGYGFGIGDVKSYAGPMVIRSFDTGDGQAAKDRQLAEGTPLLAVLGTETDDPAAWLSTGRALQRVLLRAQSQDVWASHLNQPVEVAELRPRLAQAIGRREEFPQVLLRFGYGSAAQPQPRRAVDEVIVAGRNGVGHPRHLADADIAQQPDRGVATLMRRVLRPAHRDLRRTYTWVNPGARLGPIEELQSC